MSDATFVTPIEPVIHSMRRARIVSAQVSDRAFFGGFALLFAASVAATMTSHTSMTTMGDVPMPDGWTISMVWMRMCGQTWPGAAARFLAMWVPMMVAMMLPSLVPSLWCTSQTLARIGETRLGWRTALAAAGYFVVWSVLGMAVFPLGATLAAAEMRQPVLTRVAPVAAAVIVLIAGAIQFTAWKARHLACCRNTRKQSWNGGSAWQYGLRLGLHCSLSCAGLTAILLVVGLMDLRVMAAVTAATTLERLAPSGEAAARLIGGAAIGSGLILLARSVGLG